MKLTPGRLKTLALAALAAGLLIVLLVGRHDHSQPAAASKSGVAASRNTTPAAATPKPKPVKPAAKPANLALLRQRVAGFIRSYYLLKPGDTAAVRRRRVAPFSTPRLLDRLVFTPDKAHNQTVEAVADDGQMTIQVKHDLARVVVPVSVFVQRQGRSSERYIGLTSTSRWRWQTGKWVIVNFN